MNGFFSSSIKPQLIKYRAFMLVPILLMSSFLFASLIDFLYPPVVLSEFVYIAGAMTLCCISAWALVVIVFSSLKTSLSAFLVLTAYVCLMLLWFTFK